jgi:hypothetical protein
MSGGHWVFPTGYPIACTVPTVGGAGPGSAGMSFGIYLAGFIIVIIGLALGAHMMHVPPQWIGVGVLVLVGLGIVKGVASTKQRDPS